MLFLGNGQGNANDVPVFYFVCLCCFFRWKCHEDFKQKERWCYSWCLEFESLHGSNAFRFSIDHSSFASILHCKCLEIVSSAFECDVFRIVKIITLSCPWWKDCSEASCEVLVSVLDNILMFYLGCFWSFGDTVVLPCYSNTH